MPDPSTQNQNNQNPITAPTVSTTSQQSGTVTSIPVHTDLPPLPDFMLKNDESMTQSTTASPVTPPTVITPASSDTSSGSAAPVDLPPMIATPKKKFGGGKVIATILGILLLVGGVGAGLYLTGQQQIFKQKAADNTATDSGTVTIPENSSEPVAIPDTGLTGSENSTPSATATDSPTATPASSGSVLSPESTTTGVDNGSGTITLTMPKMSPNCQFGKYDNETGKNDCIRARQYDTGTFSVPTGCTATGITISSANSSFKYDDYLLMVLDGTIISGHSTMNLTGKAWGWNTVKGLCYGTNMAKTSAYVCYNATTCTVPKSQSAGSVNIVYSQSNLTSVLASGGSHTFSVIAGGDNDPSTDCSMAQDLQLKLSYTCSGPTPTPTPPPGTPACLNVKAYDTSWKTLADSDLSGLLTGTHIKLCVASNNTADKAQFSINGTLEPETTAVRPSSTDFCQDYTILSTDTTVSVKAKVHYPSQGWYGENI